MAGLTLANCETYLAEAEAALSVVISGGEEVTIRGRTLKSPSIESIQAIIDYWDKKCKELDAQGSRSGRRMRGITPVT